MVGLSEKAKGKQRAIQPPADVIKDEESPQYRDLRIRFSDGVPDVTVTIRPSNSIRDVKRLIRDVRPMLENRRLRFIHAGRMLGDGTPIFTWLKLQEQKQKPSTENDLDSIDLDSGKGKDVVLLPGQLPSVWMNCSVGAEIPVGEVDDDESKVQETQIKPLRGFDRLAAAGFSEEDIAAFRRTFHSQSEGDYLDDEDFGEDEDYEEHSRVLEEQWIDSLDNASSASLTQSSSPSILQGILIGFFFPLIPFFFFYGLRPPVFWDRGQELDRVRSVIFSKQMQLALTLGFAINVTLGLWRYLLGP